MSSLLESVVAFFHEDEWPFQMSDEGLIRSMFQGDNGKWACQGWVREAEQQFVFYSSCPIAVPEARISDVVEFITRANFCMIIGNFEIDYSDGEIRYKTSIQVEPQALTPDVCGRVVYANVMLMDQYLPGIMAVITGAATPQQAIAQIEAH